MPLDPFSGASEDKPAERQRKPRGRRRDVKEKPAAGMHDNNNIEEAPPAVEGTDHSPGKDPAAGLGDDAKGADEAPDGSPVRHKGRRRRNSDAHTAAKASESVPPPTDDDVPKDEAAAASMDEQRGSPGGNGEASSSPTEEEESATQSEGDVGHHFPGGKVPRNHLEMHIIGEIEGGKGFPPGAYIKFKMLKGHQWKIVSGRDKGLTQQDVSSRDENSGAVIFAHPIDLHLAMRATGEWLEKINPEDWPRLHVQAWEVDHNGKDVPCGYGVVHMPMAPGSFELECPTWMPTNAGDMHECLLGNPMVLMSPAEMMTPAGRKELCRYALETESSGTVMLNIGIIMKEPLVQKEGIQALANLLGA